MAYTSHPTSEQPLTSGVWKLIRDDAPPVDFAPIADKRKRMVDNGYSPLAILNPWSLVLDDKGQLKSPGKAPANRSDGGSWRLGHDDVRLFKPAKIATNTGALAGAGDLIGLDFDTPEPAHTKEVGALARKHGVPVRDAPMRGRSDGSGKILFMLRAPDIPKKMKTACQHGVIEVLTHGEQFVVDGLHANSNLGGGLIQYVWHSQRGAPWRRPLTDLPTTNFNQLFSFMSDVLSSGLLGQPLVPPLRQGAGGTAEGARLRELREQHGGNVLKAVEQLIAEAVEGTRHASIGACVGTLMPLGAEFALSILEPLVRQHHPEKLGELEAWLSYSEGKFIERAEDKAKWLEVKGLLREHDLNGAFNLVERHATDQGWRSFYGKTLVTSLACRGARDIERLTEYARWALGSDDVGAVVDAALAFEHQAVKEII